MQQVLSTLVSSLNKMQRLLFIIAFAAALLIATRNTKHSQSVRKLLQSNKHCSLPKTWTKRSPQYMHHLALRILCRSTGWSSWVKFSASVTYFIILIDVLAENSEPLRQLLHNPHLRALLQQIDVAYNANLAMTAAMQEPLFVEFANACLQVVEPMTEAERAELELCSWKVCCVHVSYMYLKLCHNICS